MSYTTNTRSLTSRPRHRKRAPAASATPPAGFTEIALTDSPESSLPGSEISDTFYPIQNYAPTSLRHTPPPQPQEDPATNGVRNAVAQLESLVDLAGDLARSIASRSVSGPVPVPLRSSSLSLPGQIWQERPRSTSQRQPGFDLSGHPRSPNRYETPLLGDAHHEHPSWLGALEPRDVVSPKRKAVVASISCTITTLIGHLIGLYAGLVPSIQYYIVDFNHYAILGNCFMYVGMAIPTAFFWPLPMLHGRKPYMIGGLAIATPLLFPQAIAVQEHDIPWETKWRVLLLLGRGLMGIALGFVSMNSFMILTDVYGCSLVRKPKKDKEDDPVDPPDGEYNPGPSQAGNTDNPNTPPSSDDHGDPKLHGGGMDIWLGIWTFSFAGSISMGFATGAIIIDNFPPAVGMYVSICLISAIIFLVVICPEPRQTRISATFVSSARDSEVRHRNKTYGRGQVKMHREGVPPRNAGEEMLAGILLMKDLLLMPGFAVMALYYSWVYGQVVLIIVILGALISREYVLEAHWTGLCVLAMAAGASLAIPFGAHEPLKRLLSIEDKWKLGDHAFWHFGECRFKRRVVFVTALPLATAGYAVASMGPSTHIAVPILMAALVGFLSGLAIGESNGLIMEAFDTSDHSHDEAMIGRPRHVRGRDEGQPTNYSAYPRVAAAFAVVHSGGFVVAALSTAVGGAMTRNWGARIAAGVMAGILAVLGIALLLVLVKWKGMLRDKDGHGGEEERVGGWRWKFAESLWMSGRWTRWGEEWREKKKKEKDTHHL
ncbi:hypothetical protein MKZ38_007708 [Zalerion maritima]|uniref:Uncharacterized protein n=1 Tax=Zalerion maritima TaxID=339359 RepID=A0AAD5RII2_9PEZI|nr:hypothetical protein MKZ38_007708 [Zalerion maritima]